jgi:thioredoxin 1
LLVKKEPLMRIIRTCAAASALLAVFALLSFAGKNEAARAAKAAQARLEATFVELGSVNCVPCRMMQPVMQDIEREYGDRVKVVFHDVWTKEGEPYGRQYKIQAIPTQVFLDGNGREFYRHMGFFSKEEIAKVLEKRGISKTKAPAGNRGTKKGDK